MTLTLFFMAFFSYSFFSPAGLSICYPNYGMICNWIFKLLKHYHVSKRGLKPICFRSLFLLSFSCYQTLIIPGDDPVMVYDLRFMHYELDSVPYNPRGLKIEHMDT